MLHTVGFRDGGRLRPVAHRMSFAEMIVPYRDATADHYRRTAFDIGEWGLGFMTTSLELGCDCLGEIRYLDAVVHDSRGEPRDDPQRDLHPRGGRRHPVEARGRAHRRARCGARAGAGAVVPRDRGQLRVPGLLALLPGREHRVRGAGHRHHGDLVRSRPGAQPPTGDAGRRAHLRALSTSTSSWPGSTSTSTGSRNTVYACESQPLPVERRQPARAGAGGPARRRCGPSATAGRTTTGRPSAAWKVASARPATGWARRPPTSWCRAAASRR